METKFYVPVVVNNIRVITYFATNLAIILIRKSVAEGLKCVLYPVSGPDASFIDPATARVFPLLWETRLTLTTKDQPIWSTAYIVQDEEIGASIIIGIDTIIAIKGTIIIDEEEHSNPLFPIMGDEKVLYPKPVWATGLGVSLASPAYASKSETAVVSHDGPDQHYDCVTRNVHLLAANTLSPPVPPAHTINSRPDMPKVRSKRPCAIPMHGVKPTPGVAFKEGGYVMPREPTCPSEATHPAESTCPAESTSPAPPATTTISAYVTPRDVTPECHPPEMPTLHADLADGSKSRPSSTGPLIQLNQ
ncbi:hypothetical protein DAPPUDRAFT_242663 [Daphnia pulex]|uniref:Uncharacterized protein n=1 Tax=Daphnia pulex TaxID=6669 RepID=E9GH69_DAPPU|nr:hypothetical protein DAPPUDRAFT_242663 [Daphnia pulex]|eukprot:EFX81241.1 hypothetical protein DAPPUDRAFT_242663 [Daphnia pulex]